MYSTCIFCGRDLGRNQVLESFPAGRRLAFDAAQGRLWVVCRRCGRWNLTPLEERWEAIEQSESLFRMAPRRMSTENIGLARLREGTELVRIGRPLRPEYAAWRYGDQFGHRRRRQLARASLGVGAIGIVAFAPVAIGFTITGLGVTLGAAGSRVLLGGEEVIARLRTESHGVISIRRRHLQETRLLPGVDSPLAMDLRFQGGGGRLEGREALRIASVLMPHVNRYAGARALVESAARTMEHAGGPEGYLERLARHVEDATYVPRGWMARRTGGLHGLSGTDRLALEMALHEEAEERAIRGDLVELERAWREAEEIAAIADDLLTPSAVTDALSQSRRT